MIRWFFVVGCIVAAASSARAFPSPRFTVSGGVAFPAGPSEFTDAWNLGPALGAGAAFEVSSRITIGVEVDYSWFSFDDSYTGLPNVTVDGYDLDVLTAGVTAEIALRTWGTTKPFLLAGTGYDSVKRPFSPAAVPPTLPDFGDDGVALWVGGGVRTMLTPAASLCIEAAYHFGTSDESPSFVPIRLGVSF